MSVRSQLAGAGAVAAVLLSGPVAAEAQQQSLVFHLGHNALRGVDARVDDDVLLENRDVFSFDLGDLNGVTVGGEWLVGLGDHLEAGVGVDFFRAEAPSTYADYVDEDGSEIVQDFRLRSTPILATLRYFPFGSDTPVRPYVGGGIGLVNWRYGETGDFIDFRDFSVFNDRYVAEGNSLGSVFLGGVRFPFGSAYAAGVEVRYLRATGRVGVDRGFLAERIDLGGLSTRFTFQVGF